MNALVTKLFQIDDYLKTLGLRYVYCGSISMIVHGMGLMNFHDADIDFVDLSDEEKLGVDVTEDVLPDYLDIDINKMFSDGLEDLRVGEFYEEIEYEGRKFLVSKLEYEVEVRKRLIKMVVDKRETDKSNSEWDLKFLEKCRTRITQIQNFLKKKKNR